MVKVNPRKNAVFESLHELQIKKEYKHWIEPAIDFCTLEGSLKKFLEDDFRKVSVKISPIRKHRPFLDCFFSSKFPYVFVERF